MNKTVIASIVVGVIAIFGGLYLASSMGNNESAQNSDNHQASEVESMPTKNPAANESAEPVNTDTVKISDFAFQPKTITVKKGTTVTWKNDDVAKHDVKPDNESADFMGSKLLSKGESYSWTFNTAGTYNYHCTPHPYMKATVVVTE